ncbi:MAG: dienelactone hydrolase family protein, partial [Chitinophagaceae bacterium]
MDQQIINLYDEYTHKPLTRQDFLQRLAILTGGMAAAMTVLPLLESCAPANKTTDDELFTERISYTGGNGNM